MSFRTLSHLPIPDIYIDITPTGADASNYFHQSSRYKASSVTGASPYRMWNSPKLRANWLKVLWSMNYPEINSKVLRQGIALRGYLASQFRPSAAKAIYELLESKNVLDFSSGWGDRLAGFASANLTKRYVGCDPNSNLFDGYRKQIDLYGSAKKFEFINAPAEDVDFGKNEFDTVFTSPPFFRSERYTNDANQSWKRYKTLKDWLEGFLFTSIKGAYRALKPNGFFVLNLADVYSEGKVNQLVEPTFKYLEQCGASYVDSFGYRIQSRPQIAEKGLVNAEGVYVWRKK